MRPPFTFSAAALFVKGFGIEDNQRSRVFVILMVVAF
jgi:hypothetical protein